MRAVHLFVPVLVLAAAAASLGSSTTTRPIEPRAGAHADTHAASPTRARAEVQRRRYALDYRHQISLDGRSADPTWIRGTWTTEALADGRVATAISGAQIGGLRDAPRPEDVTAPFQIALDRGGQLARLGFAPETPQKARDFLTTIACALWYTPGEGDTWTVEEEDRVGRYLAVYARRGDEVTRRRERYVAVRRGGGLDPKHAGRYTATGTTHYRFDAGGLTEVIVDERLGMALGDGAPKVELHVQATLRLLASEARVAREEDALSLEAPRAFGEGDGASAEQIERARLDGAGLPDLLAAVETVRPMAAGSHEEQTWRADTFLKLRALARVEPGSARSIGDALKAHAADDVRMVSVLAGALGEARTQEATGVLTELVSADMSPVARMQVVAALGLATPDAASAAALTAALDDPAVGSASALALGSQSGHLAPDDPATAREAVYTLLERYAQATTPAERRTYLQALANSGAPEAFAVMRAAISGSDGTLAELAAYGLRFIPGAHVDALLLELLRGAAPDRIKVQAIRAIAFRAQETWEAPLREALAQHAENEAVRTAIRNVLATWAS